MWPPTAWKILEGFCTRTLRNCVCCLHRTPQQLCLLSAPEPSEPHQPSGTLQNLAPDRSKPHQRSASEPSGTLVAICTRTLQNFISHLHQNPPQTCVLTAPQPFGTSSAICNNPPELCCLPAPEPSRTSSAIPVGTLRNLSCRNLISFLPRNSPEPCLLSAPEPSGTSYLRRNPPEPSPEPSVAAAPDRTRAILG